MNMLPVKWEAMKRSTYGVLGAGGEEKNGVLGVGNENGQGQIVEDGDEALELGSKVKWVKDLWQVWRFWVEGAGCGGPEWVDDEGSEAGL